MNLESYALISEIVSAIAVVASLIFVGLEVRKNTAVNQAATFQGSVSHDLDILIDGGDTPEKARVWFLYRDNPDSLTDNEKMQGALMWGAATRHAENLYMQYINGMLNKKSWEAREPLIKVIINSEGFKHSQREYWAGMLDGAFAEYVRKNQVSTQ